MTLVFQYGSYTSAIRFNSNNRLRGDANSLDAVYTAENFELDFNVFSSGNNCAAADIISGRGRKIWGVLYEIPDYLIRRETSGERRSLDAIEGEGGNYERQIIEVKHADGTPVEGEVITYVVRDKREGLQTNLDYCRHIIEGLREHNAPDEYIEYVKGRMIANDSSLQNEVNAL